MLERSATWPRHAAAACVGASGLLLVAALFVPFADHGTGSAESSHELADFALSDTLRPFVQPWLGALWYLTGFIGCAAVATCLVGGRAVAVARFLSACLATAVAIVVAVQLGTAGPATRLSVTAWVLTALATVVHLVSASATTPPDPPSEPLPNPPCDTPPRRRTASR